MCGIVAYTGEQKAREVLIRGLEDLEYRGYDSAGIAAVVGRELLFFKEKGRVARLALSTPEDLPASTGIAHTRWATHGGVTRANAHPHLDSTGRIAVVHNGIIDNHAELRRQLEAGGVEFASETDTEVLAHLISAFYRGDPVAAVRQALLQVEGTWGIAVLFKDHPDRIVTARNGSPIVVGIGSDEMFVASDARVISRYTERVVYLEDGDIAMLSPRMLATSTLEGAARDHAVHTVARTTWEDDLRGFPHYMLKEIHDQPSALERLLAGRISDGGVRLAALEELDLTAIRGVTLLACGTSFHASTVGARLIEQLARIPARAEVASEFWTRNPVIPQDHLYLAVSQSGETYDTLQAALHVQKQGGTVLGIVNAVGSSIARACGAGVYLHCGSEIAVASTKSFTSQVAALHTLALALAHPRMERWAWRSEAAALQTLPDRANETLRALGEENADAVEAASQLLAGAPYVLFMGRGCSAAVAAEGALKLKELAYTPCDAYAAGEMKHGPIAMIDRNTPVVVVVPEDEHRAATLSNVQEVRARGGRVIAIHTRGDHESAGLADVSIPLPDAHPAIAPTLAVLALQHFAYRAAVLEGCDVDKPRNLAKSVTVA